MKEGKLLCLTFILFYFLTNTNFYIELGTNSGKQAENYFSGMKYVSMLLSFHDNQIQHKQVSIAIKRKCLEMYDLFHISRVFEICKLDIAGLACI